MNVLPSYPHFVIGSNENSTVHFLSIENEVTKTTIPANLRPNGCIWERKSDNLEYVVRSSLMEGPPTAFRWNYSILEWIPGQPLRSRTPIDYFNLLFPVPTIPKILHHTNSEIRHLMGNNHDISEKEFRRYIGVRLAMTLHPLHSVDEYWRQSNPLKRSVSVPFNMGRFGISKHRFEMIERCLSFDKPNNVGGWLSHMKISIFLICECISCCT